MFDSGLKSPFLDELPFTDESEREAGPDPRIELQVGGGTPVREVVIRPEIFRARHARI